MVTFSDTAVLSAYRSAGCRIVDVNVVFLDAYIFDVHKFS